MKNRLVSSAIIMLIKKELFVLYLYTIGIVHVCVDGWITLFLAGLGKFSVNFFCRPFAL